MTVSYPLPMTTPGVHWDSMVTGLLPSLSRSLAEEFNIFRVMRHGTHEKQLSNVFAWLLDPVGTHELGGRIQERFLRRVNAQRPDRSALPLTGYRVRQEVDTRTPDEIAASAGMDIADIVLLQPGAAVVIENYGTSDGHGHGFTRYQQFAAAGERDSAVVLLCGQHEQHLLHDGWENAIVITYDDLVSDVSSLVQHDRAWQRSHPEQLFFIRQMHHHFVEGPAAVNADDQLDFLLTMCETGESARYAYRPQDRAADEFAELVAEHARRQFADGRAMLQVLKANLRSFARGVLMAQLNEVLDDGPVLAVSTRFVGTWEWIVELQRPEGFDDMRIPFGPSAVAENATMPEPLATPDYSRVFVSLGGRDRAAHVLQTDVPLREVHAGLDVQDTRLRDAVLELLRQTSR